MPPSLLQSQLETLEPLQADEAGLTLATDGSIEALVHQIIAQLPTTVAA
jgi:gluconate kinase